MPYRNFIVSGMGYSGTQFLASNLDRSPSWTVRHEMKPHRAVKPIAEEIEATQQRFNRNYYGEVNSLLIFVLDEMNVAAKGIVLRRPSDILWSLSECKGVDWQPHEQWMRWLEMVDDCAERYPVLVFDDMIRSPEAVASFGRLMGVGDLTAEMIDMTKVGQKRRGIYSRFSECPLYDYWPRVKWFEHKWFGVE